MLKVKKMNNSSTRTKYIVLISLLLSYCGQLFADGLGGVASNIMEPVGLFNDMIDTACFVIGGAFLFATIIKYFEHRRSPLMVPISTVIFLLIAGLILIGLPFLSYVVNGSVQYSLFSR